MTGARSNDECKHAAREIWADATDTNAHPAVQRGRCIDCRAHLYRERRDNAWTPWSTEPPDDG